MKTMLKVASAAGLLGLAAASSSALAAPLPYLTYEQYAGWTDVGSTFNPGDTGWTGLEFNDPTGGAYPPSTYTNISWYGITEGRDPSFIDIISHSSSDGSGNGLATPGEWHAGEWGIITTLTQTNNPLNSNTATMPNPLWTVDAVANLHIGDNNGNNIFSDLNNVTEIEFWETNNLGSTCSNPNPLGTACDDIFRVTALDFAPLQFTHDGYEYTVAFTLLPGPSTDGDTEVGQTLICTSDSALADCAGLGVTEGEIWVFTPEYNPGTSTVYVAMSYSVRAVPEPSVVALFALGMLGLGFAARRRKEDTVA